MPNTCIRQQTLCAVTETYMPRVGEVKMTLHPFPANINTKNRSISLLVSGGVRVRMMGNSSYSLSYYHRISDSLEEQISNIETYSGWVAVRISGNQTTDCTLFFSPSSHIQGIRLGYSDSFREISTYVGLDWFSLLNVPLTRLFVYKSHIEPSIVAKLNMLQQWNSMQNKQMIDIAVFRALPGLTFLDVDYSNIFGDGTDFANKLMSNFKSTETPYLLK